MIEVGSHPEGPKTGEDERTATKKYDESVVISVIKKLGTGLGLSTGPLERS